MKPLSSRKLQHPPRSSKHTPDTAQVEPADPLPIQAGRDLPMTPASARTTVQGAYLPSSSNIHPIFITASSTATAPADAAPAFATSIRQAETGVPSDAASSFDSLLAAERITMPVMIDPSFVILLRGAVRGGYGATAQVLCIEPVPRSNDVKVVLALTRSAVDDIMLAIMRSLPRAMFGRISRS